MLDREAKQNEGTGRETQESIISRAVDDVKGILDGDNPCSKFFGGSKGSLEALGRLAALLKPGPIQDTKVGIRQDGAQSIFINAQTGFKYRLFANATVNNRGAFFTTFDVSSSPIKPLPNYGGFAPNTREVRAIMILHELAHLVYGSDGNPLIPNDKDDPNRSETNTSIVEKECGDLIRNLKVRK